MVLSLWSYELLGQQSIEDWATYFKSKYNVEILTDSIGMGKLELQKRTHIKGSSGINFVAHQFGIEYQFNQGLLKDHLALLAREFSKYPDFFFRKIDLKFLCLAEKVAKVWHFLNELGVAVPHYSSK